MNRRTAGEPLLRKVLLAVPLLTAATAGQPLTLPPGAAAGAAKASPGSVSPASIAALLVHR